MPKVAGRKVRWSLSTDSGATYTAFGGSTSDGFTFSAEGIPVTDKDDLGWQTMLNDVGTRSAEGSSTLFIEDATIAALLLNNPSDWLHDLKFDIDGLFQVTGEFFITSFNPSGAEGAEAATAEVSFTSSGVLTYATS
jgi:predicted secreted protein